MVWGITIWASGSIRGKRKTTAEVVPLSCGFDGTLRQSRLQNFVTFVGRFALLLCLSWLPRQGTVASSSTCYDSLNIASVFQSHWPNVAIIHIVDGVGVVHPLKDSG